MTLRWMLVFAAALLFAVGGDGPDFGRYLEWGYAALFRDIFELQGNVLSPAGVPFSLASSGPGLLVTTLYEALGETVEYRRAAYLAGWLAAMVFWACAFSVLRACAGGHRWLVLFGAGALFIGTHAGRYSHEYSTEVFANAFVAALWAMALAQRRWPLAGCAAAGALAGLLLLVRPYLVLYAAAPLLLIAAGGHDGLRRWKDTALRLAVAAIPAVIAAAQYAMVNRWMTGSFLHPPYVYGGFGFSSVDLLQPEIGAVLMHPWHGLLSYHPLYAVALAALVVEAMRGGSRFLFGAALAAVLVHVWVQSSWYIWWLGGTSFGMRGLAPAALPLLAALVTLIARVGRVGAAIRPDPLYWVPGGAVSWVRVATLACVWSFSLLLQGNTQFLTWPELVAAQRWAFVACAGCLAAWAGHSMWKRSRAEQGAVESEVRYTGLVLLAGSIAYLLTLAPGVSRVALAMAAATGVTAGSVWLTTRAPSASIGWIRSVSIAAVLVLFALQAVLFARLAQRTELFLAAGAPPPREFRYRGTPPIDELRQSYAEYLQVRGFDGKKRAFGTYLNWLHIETTPMTEPDRQTAEQVLRTLAADPLVAGVQLEITAADGVVRLAGAGTNEAQRTRARELAVLVPGVVSVDDRME